MQKRLHGIVHGRVQGVSFRFYTLQFARDLDLTGWVRNTPEGTVEITAEGRQNSLERLNEFLKEGSPAAQVTDVDVEWSDATGEFDDFRVMYGSP